MTHRLEELFPDEDYRFHLTLRRVDPAEFFASPDPELLRQRRHWLGADPDRYSAFRPPGLPLLNEWEGLAAGWNPGLPTLPRFDGDPRARLAGLSAALAPDVLLLARGSEGTFTLVAGAVCFPSSWSLEEKMGRGLEEIHVPVPGLNAGMGPTITQFLARMRPGIGYGRANWGLAATPELNLHPALGRPRLDGTFDRERTWLRIEDQLLITLPSSGGLLFGIAIRVYPLDGVLRDPVVRRGFARALQSMPDDLAAYKGLAGIRAALIAAATGPTLG
jgi:hypothetical protein